MSIAEKLCAVNPKPATVHLNAGADQNGQCYRAHCGVPLNSADECGDGAAVNCPGCLTAEAAVMPTDGFELKLGLTVAFGCGYGTNNGNGVGSLLGGIGAGKGYLTFNGGGEGGGLGRRGGNGIGKGIVRGGGSNAD